MKNHESSLQRIFRRILCWRKPRQTPLNERSDIVSALENLTAAVTRLQGSVDNAVTTINTPHPTDAQVQTAADAVNAQSERLDFSVNPPAPTAPSA